MLRARVYWLRSDLPALMVAMDRFQGRSAFEAERRHAKARAALAEGKPKRPKQSNAIPQPDLFDASDTAGPGGAERANRARRY